ncbi:MAG: roadblock/LC7 domain-containing protein [Promethearchaeota archaeon]
MSAAILSVSERAVEELSRGDLKRILIEGADGTIILSKAGENAILATLCSADASLGMIFLNIQAVSKKISELLD